MEGQDEIKLTKIEKLDETNAKTTNTDILDDNSNSSVRKENRTGSRLKCEDQKDENVNVSGLGAGIVKNTNVGLKNICIGSNGEKIKKRLEFKKSAKDDERCEELTKEVVTNMEALEMKPAEEDSNLNYTGIEDGQEELLINIQDSPEEEPILKLSLKKIDVSSEDESKQRSMIMYNPEDGDLNEWLQNNKPSEVRSDGVTWIAAVTFERTKEECMEELKEAWETMVANSDQISHSMVTTFAKQFGVTGGRWIFHVTTDRVDILWGRVAKAWRDGKLGPNIIQAKVSAVFDPYGSCDSRVISVCNRDSTSEEQVLQVETSLRQAKIRCMFYYKPNIYSALGIYKSNRWGLIPTIYHSQYHLMRGESIIQKKENLMSSF